MRPRIYIDTVAPIRYGLFDLRSALLLPHAKSALARLPLPPQSKLEFRDHDGGAFVLLPDSYSDADVKSLQQTLSDQMEPQFWALWRRPKCWAVRGSPWLEDMNRFPHRMLYVNAPGASQEQLYSLFRPFGKIHDILPPDPKANPPENTIIFTYTRDASAARNVMHNALIPVSNTNTDPSDTAKIHIKYHQVLHGHVVWSWVQNHPRIVLPALAVVLATLSYIIFDPIREKFVESHIHGSWDPQKYKVFRWLKHETMDRLGLGSKSSSNSRKDAPHQGIENERDEAINQLRNWLKDDPETYLSIIGPRGSGKGTVISSALSGHRNVLYIDPNILLKRTSSEARLVAELARQTGYKPHFSFLSTLNNWIDLASVGLIGQKAGFAESLESQLKKILQVTSSALRSLSLQVAAEKTETQRIAALKKWQQEDASVDSLRAGSIHDGRLDAIAGNGVMSELGGGIENDQSMWQIYGPETSKTARDFFSTKGKPDNENDSLLPPVVVIRGFDVKGNEQESLLWNVIMDWTASLVENKVSHVIICSDNSQVHKRLGQALPNKPISIISLTDAKPEAALQYVRSKLTVNDDGSGSAISSLGDENTAQKAIKTLGGRKADLELLIHKLQMGMKIEEAVEDILSRSISEVKKNMFESSSWNNLHAFYLLNELANKNQIGYEDALFNGPFKGNEDPLRALEQKDLISIINEDKGRVVIQAGKPVYLEAFKRLSQDKVFVAKQKVSINKSIKLELEQAIKNAEEELVQLSHLVLPAETGKWVFSSSSKVPSGISKRVANLLTTIEQSQKKIDAIADESSKQNEILRKSSNK